MWLHRGLGEPSEGDDGRARSVRGNTVCSLERKRKLSLFLIIAICNCETLRDECSIRSSKSAATSNRIKIAKSDRNAQATKKNNNQALRCNAPARKKKRNWINRYDKNLHLPHLFISKEAKIHFLQYLYIHSSWQPPQATRPLGIAIVYCGCVQGKMACGIRCEGAQVRPRRQATVASAGGEVTVDLHPQAPQVRSWLICSIYSMVKICCLADTQWLLFSQSYGSINAGDFGSILRLADYCFAG